jgi:tetratricopeptide (TPR) repeat protein
MALLTINERRDLIKPFLEEAKINWGTIALAQLIVKNFVGRVLTANFDLVLEKACGLLGLQPAVYDFGVAPASDPAMVVSPSIIHLHGQSYGLVLLNTDEETKKHREKLRPILTDSLRNAPLVVIGYSGSADGIFQTLLEEFEGREQLYWTSYEEEPNSHIRAFSAKEHFHFIGGADFDRFMITLAQSLECWPPGLFADPLGHLLDELRPVVPYPVIDSESAIDLLVNLRRKLATWQHQSNDREIQAASLQELYMKGDFEGAARLFSSRSNQEMASDVDKNIAFWSFVGWGNRMLIPARQIAAVEDARRLLVEAAQKYRAALAIKPNEPVALNNWANALLELSKLASKRVALKLIAEAREKYRSALAIKPNYDSALNGWGNSLSLEARIATEDEAVLLLAEANEKFRLALAAKPDNYLESLFLGSVNPSPLGDGMQ